MQMSGNTILITGGGSGIGRALAEAFHALGNQVLIAGRRQQVLQETVAANPGMKSTVFDIENPDAIRSFAAQVAKDYPALNAVIHNAGIMRPEEVKTAQVADSEAIVTTNLLGPIRLTAALLPAVVGTAPGHDHDRFIRVGVRAPGLYTHLLRDQGGHSLVHPVTSLSA